MQRPRPISVVLLAATLLCALIDRELNMADDPEHVLSMDVQADASTDTGHSLDL